MPPVLAVLFWICVVVSLVLLLRRRAARKAAASTGTVGEIAEPRVETDEFLETVPASAAVAPAAALPPPASALPPPASALPPPVPALTPPAAADPLAERRSTRRGAPAAGVADALVGIRMPCQLVPLVDRLATDRIALSTTGYPAEVVGTALADELERLGYVLKPLTDHELIATRGGTELHLRLQRPDIDGRHLDHPTARADAVVVEIDLRA
jgi:hypothetical protein